MKNMKKLLDSKIISVIIILIIYIIAFIGGYLSYKWIPLKNELLKFLVADVIATCIVFIGSMICHNSSVYDPYWSVLPMVVVPFFIGQTIGFKLVTIVILVIVELWGLRLTMNWLMRFKNLKHQDWRYVNIQTKHPKLWPLISLFGVHLLPTLVVYIAMLPIFGYVDAFKPIEVDGQLTYPMNINGTYFICIIVALFAIIIETVADLEMDAFRKNPENKGKINRKGLWKKSRHPNYFGEILLWFSMFLFYMSVDGTLWVLIFSPLIVFLLFVIVSIPMLEKRELNNKEGYAEYKKETNMLIPFFAPNKK